MVLIIMLVMMVTTILMFIYIGFWVSFIIFITLVGIYFIIRLIFKMLMKGFRKDEIGYDG